MSPVRFLQLNLVAIERRLRALTAARRDDEEALWVAMDSSVVGRAVVAVSRGIDGAAPASRAAQPIRKAVTLWSALAPLLRMQAIGAISLIAATAHLAMQMTARPVGWWWLILPGIAASFGVAALTIAWIGRTGRRP